MLIVKTVEAKVIILNISNVKPNETMTIEKYLRSRSTFNLSAEVTR